MAQQAWHLPLSPNLLPSSFSVLVPQACSLIGDGSGQHRNTIEWSYRVISRTATSFREIGTKGKRCSGTVHRAAALAGIDVKSRAFKSVLQTTLDAIENNFGVTIQKKSHRQMALSLLMARCPTLLVVASRRRVG